MNIASMLALCRSRDRYGLSILLVVALQIWYVAHEPNLAPRRYETNRRLGAEDEVFEMAKYR